MLVCTECSAKNPDSAMYCNACGKFLSLRLLQKPAPKKTTSISLAILIALILGVIGFGMVYFMFTIPLHESFVLVYIGYCWIIAWLGAHGFYDNPHFGRIRVFFGLTLTGMAAPFILFMAGMYISRSLNEFNSSQNQ